MACRGEGSQTDLLTAMVGEYLDVASGAEDGGERRVEGASAAAKRRAFLGVHFVCCDVYTRIYVNRERTAYVGHCPKCSRPVTVRIGPNVGTHAT